MAKVIQRRHAIEAWHYPAAELANLSAMPQWLVDISATGGDDIVINDVIREKRAKPGDWIVRTEPDVVLIVDAETFAKGWIEL